MSATYYLVAMLYSSAEDRLNPVSPADADDSTLGGYTAVHGRAAAFQGGDGQPYTVAIDAEPASDLRGWVGYLVFLRWAGNGSAVMGHLESPNLACGATEREARTLLEAMPLSRVHILLNEAILRTHSD